MCSCICWSIHVITDHAVTLDRALPLTTPWQDFGNKFSLVNLSDAEASYYYYVNDRGDFQF